MGVRVAVPARDLRRRDSVCLADRRKLRFGTGAADEGRVECTQEFLEALRYISLRIDGYIDHLNVGCRSPELAPSLSEGRERHGAYLRTRGVAESEQDDFAAKAAESQLVSIGALQDEIRRGARWIEDARLECRWIGSGATGERDPEYGRCEPSGEGDTEAARMIHNGMLAGRAWRANRSSTYVS